jgi:hypothetical protein
MKYLFSTLLLTGLTLSFAEQPKTPIQANEDVQNAIQRVEKARASTITSLQEMIQTVENARAKSTPKDISIATQIIEAHAISEIAKSTANVEITKARSMNLITQAMDKLNPHALSIIANSIAEVEVAKAKAKEKIIKVTQRVELSKTKSSPELKYPNETLTIAKNLAAIQIAKAVAHTEMEKAISNVEIVKSNAKNKEKSIDTLPSKKDQEELASIKATATANISSYLARIEVVKANMISKIAKEISRVEIAKIKMSDLKENTTYPKKLIKVN